MAATLAKLGHLSRECGFVSLLCTSWSQRARKEPESQAAGVISGSVINTSSTCTSPASELLAAD